MAKKKKTKKKSKPLTSIINYAGNEKKLCKDCGNTYTCDYIMHQAFCSANAAICDECGVELSDEDEQYEGLCSQCYEANQEDLE